MEEITTNLLEEEIYNENPFKNFEKKDCENHKLLNCENKSKINLQCGHVLCFECVKTNIEKTFGKEMCIVKLDKRKIYNFEGCDQIKKDAYFTMNLSTEETSGLIDCFHCNVKYSILSPIYRDFGFPKRVDSAIVFKEEEQVLFYYLSTAIDIVHLLRKEKQIEILQNFNYENENKLLKNLISKNNPEIYELKSQKDFYVAVQTDDVLFTLIEFDKFEKEKYTVYTLTDFSRYLQIS